MVANTVKVWIAILSDLVFFLRRFQPLPERPVLDFDFRDPLETGREGDSCLAGKYSSALEAIKQLPAQCI
jgi:hypothetical protein